MERDSHLCAWHFIWHLILNLLMGTLHIDFFNGYLLNHNLISLEEDHLS